jgi:hypothetical protein
VRYWDGILARCAEQGVTPVKPFPEEANGRFAHIMDPEGRGFGSGEAATGATCSVDREDRFGRSSVYLKQFGDFPGLPVLRLHQHGGQYDGVEQLLLEFSRSL